MLVGIFFLKDLIPLLDELYTINSSSIPIDETVARSPKGQVLLVLLGDFAEYSNRKALRLKATGVYLCK